MAAECDFCQIHRFTQLPRVPFTHTLIAQLHRDGGTSPLYRLPVLPYLAAAHYRNAALRTSLSPEAGQPAGRWV